MYMRASGASELRKIWHFYIIQVLFLSIWMGRNNHLQINILKHILRMHKHDFCGEQSTYTRAILANKKICSLCMIFCGGGGPGGTENLCVGGTCPPPPGPPVATPLHTRAHKRYISQRELKIFHQNISIYYIVWLSLI